MQRTQLPCGAELIEIDQHKDKRGFFSELYRSSYGFEIKQVSTSFSRKNVVRGMHISPFWKLCTCMAGRIFDVAVNMHEESPKWDGVWLEGGDNRQLLVPPGFAHGFFAQEDSVLLYLQSEEYDPTKEQSIHWRDWRVGIQWPVAPEYTLSDKDQ